MNLSSSDSSEFNYSDLDSEVRIVVQQRTLEIKNLMRRTVQDIIEIGQKLTEVKARLGHGNYLKWLKHEFEWQERSARNFMRVAEAFKTANFADLDFAASALYLLAAPSVPEQVRQTALEMAGNGETITYSKAKKMIGEYKEREADVVPEVDSSIIDGEAIATNPTDIVEVYLPIVDVLAQTESELQMEISYIDVKLNIRGQKENLVAFLKQIQSNSDFAEEILQQIDIQTES
ncbi:MAG: hypothetical protein Tsb0014_32480 [Pleurocapsa sp.]